MSAIDATRLLESRFISGEKRVDDLYEDQETLKTDVAVLKHEVTTMILAFKAFKVALYTCAATVLAAAIIVVIFGQHP